MNILYINDELATSDGSNYHAIGILSNLKQTLGRDSVRSFPAPVDGSKVQVNHNSLQFREKHKTLMQMIRIVRKTVLSYVRAHKLCRQLEQENWAPTHVIARSVIFDTTAIQVARHFGAKLIYEVNTPMYYEHCILNKLPLAKSIERWERKVISCSDLIYTVSNTCRDMLCEHYQVSRKKFAVIPNGYMESLYASEEDTKRTIRDSIRSKEDLQGKFVVTFIGSLKKWHGIDLLCEIAESMETNPEIHFIVAGDGSEFQRIDQYCRNHNNMTYVGKLNLEEMSKYLAASDLGIMPYQKAENFYFSPLKMYDMIGAGLPFIGTDQGQIHDVCTEFLNSDFLFTDNSVNAVCKQIERIASDQEIYSDMKKALADARAHMTWSARVEQLLAEISGLLQ